MTPLPSMRKRAEDFDDAVEAVLAGTAPGASATSPLLDVVLALRAVPEPTPRPAFAAELRQRLVAEAAAASAAAQTTTQTAAHPTAAPAVRTVPHLPPRRTSHHPGRLVAAATALVVVGGTAGVATASQRAVPGDALYPVKRALEGAELELSTSDHGRGHDLLEQASHRLDEVQALLPRAGSSLSSAVAARLPDTVHAFQAQAVQGTNLLLGSFEEDRDPHVVVEVRSFARDSVDTLSGLAATAPADVLDDLGGAAVALQAVDAHAVALCGQCDDRPALQVPDDLGDAAQPDGEDHVEAGGAGGPGASPAGVDASTGDPTGDPTEVLPDDPSAPSSDPSDATDPTVPTDSGTTTPGESGQPTGQPTGTPSGTPTDGTGEDPSSTPSDTPSEGPSDEPTDGGSTPTDGATEGTTPDPDEQSTGGTDPTGGVTSGSTSTPSDPTSDPASVTSTDTDGPLDQALGTPDPA